MSVLAFPPRESYITLVNKLSLYGIEVLPSVSLVITIPKADKLVLMALASASPSLSVSVFFYFSLPARSMNESFPNCFLPLSLLMLSMIIEKIRWDLLLSSFMLVFLVFLPLKPVSNTLLHYSSLFNSLTVAFLISTNLSPLAYLTSSLSLSF